MEIRLIALAVGQIPLGVGVWGWATSGGLRFGSRLYGCLNKCLTHSLGQVAGDETTHLPSLASFQSTRPPTVHAIATRLRCFLKSSIDQNHRFI